MSSRSPHDHRIASVRTTGFESLEPRLVFSVDSWSGILTATTPPEAGDEIVQWSLAAAHEASGARYVMNDYGFDATGQTVAVIDSGIAWDHYALGGGFGGGAKIVGGWDFAERDANPYDDGPAGFHGTHVAGIVGSEDPNHPGVARGVDLVALRVFDDQGRGNLQWVEQALNWVHQHRHEFANPITTVNLSLGVEWNANNVPNWGVLEDEFARLEADGIFIAVAAGNSFGRVQTAGLAYPAVSDHVVPVASHGDDGMLSDFSQRNDRVLVAPGESIRSAVPDHLLGGTTTGAWLGASGTSMAAPYVAGASAVLRQAMEFMGYRNITQETLYDHFRATSDQFYDALTDAVYHRLNLARAVDSIVTDLEGSPEQAVVIGELHDPINVTGTIGKFSDVDAFRFTAASNGRVALDISATHELQAMVRVNGQPLALDGTRAVFDVTAGNAYTISIGTGRGTGHYEVNLQLDRHVAAMTLGSVEGNLSRSFSVHGETWFRIAPVRDGLLGVRLDNASGLGLELHDSAFNPVMTSPANSTLQAPVHGGQDYYVRVTGNRNDVTVTIDNSVTSSNGLLQVFGNNADNRIGVVESQNGLWYSVTMDGINYQIRTSSVQQIAVHGGAGNDHLFVQTGTGRDHVVMSGDRISVNGLQMHAAASGFASIHIVGDGSDQVTMHDSPGDDQFRWGGESARMAGDDWVNIATGFGTHVVDAGRGFDTAWLAGSAGVDYVTTNGHQVWLQNTATTVSADGFASFLLQGGAGNDTLILNATAVTDRVTLTGTSSASTLGETMINTSGFESTIAVAGGRGTAANINGTPANELLYAAAGTTVMTGPGYSNALLNFDIVTVDAARGGGLDSARLIDSAGDDEVLGNHQETRMSGGGVTTRARGFDSITVTSQNGGADRVTFSGTAARDVMYSLSNATWLRGSDYQFGAIGFGTVVVNGGGGNDAATIMGGAENNSLAYHPGSSRLTGFGFQITANGFQRVRMDGGGGQNSLTLAGFRNGDQLTAHAGALIAWLGESRVEASHVDWVEATAMESQSPRHEMDAVDFWFELHGQWD